MPAATRHSRVAPHHEITRRCGSPDTLTTPSSIIAEPPFGRAAIDIADQTSRHSGPYRSAARARPEQAGRRRGHPRSMCLRGSVRGSSRDVRATQMRPA
uniref:Uncharacterized protein n=1 Tax=Nonomuraea gerenzanensis TaxID=93944 RepID=A0A1M4ECH2_9ACTN|nr:hypothetical protein BN4615_P5799 [Nonomuraea gerenzanensis]